jgi:hypothetical protein
MAQRFPLFGPGFNREFPVKKGPAMKMGTDGYDAGSQEKVVLREGCVSS